MPRASYPTPAASPRSGVPADCVPQGASQAAVSHSSSTAAGPDYHWGILNSSEDRVNDSKERDLRLWSDHFSLENQSVQHIHAHSKLQPVPLTRSAHNHAVPVRQMS